MNDRQSVARGEVADIAAVVAQLDPAELRLRVKVPGQQPCLEDAHNAAAMFVVVVVGIFGLVCESKIGQFEPIESLFGVLVPGQQPCVDN